MASPSKPGQPDSLAALKLSLTETRVGTTNGWFFSYRMLFLV